LTMSQPLPINEAIAKAIADHRAMSEFVENLNHVSAIVNEPDVPSKIGKMRDFLQQHIREHFTVEELVVFPELRRHHADGRTSSLVEDLEAEHEQVRATVSSMQALLEPSAAVPDESDLLEVERAFHAVIGLLQRHAAKEDELLVPLLRNLQP
jgi:hemerythrin-like domain-containing protein